MIKVYLSSTFRDLEKYREAVLRALRRLKDTQVVAMEDYAAADERPLDKCLQDVGDCDVYIGIIAWRYGYIPEADNPERRSITELEYRHAASKHRLIFILPDKGVRWLPEDMDSFTGEGERGARIAKFRSELQKEHTRAEFKEPEELATQVIAALRNWERRNASSVQPPLAPRSTPSHARELTHQVLLAHLADDREFAREVAHQLQLRGLSVQVSAGALLARTAQDFSEVEGQIQRCHAAVVICSEPALNQLDEERELKNRVLEMMRERTSRCIALCRSPAALPRATARGFERCVDASAWKGSGRDEAEVLTAIEREVGSPQLPGRTRAVGLPYMVIAMNREEAQQLEQPSFLDTQLTGRQREHLAELTNAFGGLQPERYHLRRDDWRPFGSTGKSLRQMVEELSARLNEPNPARILTRAIKVQHYPFDVLVTRDALLLPIYSGLARQGCVVLVDELSLLHPEVREKLTASSVAASQNTTLVTISPVHRRGSAFEQVLEAGIRSQLQPAFHRFSEQFDPQCELGVDTERRLMRWMHASLPNALGQRPNSAALARFSEENGRPPDPDRPRNLFGEGDGL